MPRPPGTPTGQPGWSRASPSPPTPADAHRAWLALLRALLCRDDVDQKGEQLTGTHAYVLRFEPGHLPPVATFWNLAMYDTDNFSVDNQLGRYTIGSTTDGLQPDPDGSLTIAIQHQPPADTANWLPAPAGPFNLTLRFYGPDTSVLNGSYRLPAIQRVSLATRPASLHSGLSGRFEESVETPLSGRGGGVPPHGISAVFG